jgi:hypothetical protein
MWVENMFIQYALTSSSSTSSLLRLLELFSLPTSYCISTNVGFHPRLAS